MEPEPKINIFAPQHWSQTFILEANFIPSKSGLRVSIYQVCRFLRGNIIKRGGVMPRCRWPKYCYTVTVIVFSYSLTYTHPLITAVKVHCHRVLKKGLNPGQNPVLHVYAMNPSLYRAGRAWKRSFSRKDDSCDSTLAIYMNYCTYVPFATQNSVANARA